MARDLLHNEAKVAFEKDGWTVTHDSLDLTIGGVELYADLGAERLIAAEKGLEKIAVEIKTLGGQSLVTEFHKAMGQYDNYYLSLAELEPDRTLYLAIPENAWNDFFQRPFIQKVIQVKAIKIVIFEPIQQIILQWIK